MKKIMYINDIHILYYVLVGIIGLFVGQFVDWCNKRLPEEKKVISRDFFKIYLKNTKPNYILIILTAIIYIGILYFFGNNIVKLLEYLFLAPMLLSVFCIDYKFQIIPNRLNLSLFEVGLLFTFVEAVSDTSIIVTTFTNRFLGLLVGGGIFLLITLIGGLIAGKEAMGFGDVKLMAALGLFLGWSNILIVSALAFLLAAVISIGILIFRRKNANDYIPFGPFIVLASFIVIFTPANLLLPIVFKIFTLGLFRG